MKIKKIFLLIFLNLVLKFMLPSSDEMLTAR